MKHTEAMNENYLFRRLYRIGTCKVTPHIAVYYRGNKLGHNRLGITTTKKIGNAVQRNRARRLIAEAYRLLETDLPSGLDIVIVARKKAVYAKMQDVRSSLRQAFGSANA
ncbi:ribonuclease P protein component [Ruminococcaceae bacterium OttesenSCG-928-L11]|nr:ribonuclease P protein component [Ruminococcaceae bacterium OttesenSCG-928-L11]